MCQRIKKQELSTNLFFSIALIVAIMCSCASPTDLAPAPTTPVATVQTYKTTASTVVDTIKSLKSGGLYNIVVTGEITNDTIGAIKKELIKKTTAKVGLDLSKTTGLEFIANEAFRNCNSLTSVIIPEGVLGIGDCAFSDCSSLTRVTIPASLTYIGDTAFENCCSLTIVTIPEGVMFI